MLYSYSLEERILFEDNHIIIINKQPSEIVQADKTKDEPLSETIKKYLKKKYNKPGNVFLGVVHRLDRPVSGAVIFAKTGKALGRLNKMLRNKEIHKTYWAVVKNMPPEKQGHLIHYIYKNKQKNKSFIYKKEIKNSLLAELKYKIINKSKDYFLLKIDLLTGRHHQIRAQLAHIGCPIKGDIKYGFSRTNKNASIHLHAKKINLIHPVKNEQLTITAKPPNDIIWNFFENT
ncbi:MAG: RNA pseudouridine synthase [Bacteroidales bacterium]|nr:RNA pseudouridine synthase [Bacteroidales bacterium]